MRASLVVVLVVAGCGVDELSIEAPADDGVQTRQKEEWASEDSPFLFNSAMETRLAALPSSGEAASTPWAGSYWPVSNDTINFQWAGPSSDSPAKKYERAFGLSGLEDAVSRAHGIDAQTSQRTCSNDTQCTASKGEVCAKRRGKTIGRCIPTWWGICHAWAPAAILLPEPRVAVTRNAVTFQVQDLKALASLVHDRMETRFVSLRCDRDVGAFALDRYGRPRADECRDTNAGSYHVLLANYLGRLHQSFVEDRTGDDEVWNQPLRGFRVLSQREVTPAQANLLVGASGSSYAFNAGAKRLVAVSTEVTFIAESEPADGNTAARIAAYTRADRYEYVLELDAAGKIIGGEWVGASKTQHPDFVWLPVAASAATVADGKISYAKVRELVLESASAPAAGATGTASDDAFTLARGAWRFLGPFASAGVGAVVVEMTGTGDADLFVRVGAQASAALYDCRPWLTGSHETCTVRGPGPIYVGVSGAATSSSVTVRVRYTAVAGTGMLTASGSVGVGAMKLFSLKVTKGVAVTLRTAASADVDLYVRLGANPTSTVHDARADSPSGDETLRFVPAAAGTLIVGVRGYEAATFTLTAKEEG